MSQEYANVALNGATCVEPALTSVDQRPVVAARAGHVDDRWEEEQQSDAQQDRYDDEAVLADVAQEAAAAAALVRRGLGVAVAFVCVAAVAGLAVTGLAVAVTGGTVAAAVLAVLRAVEGAVALDERRRSGQLAVAGGRWDVAVLLVRPNQRLLTDHLTRESDRLWCWWRCQLGSLGGGQTGAQHQRGETHHLCNKRNGK